MTMHSRIPWLIGNSSSVIQVLFSWTVTVTVFRQTYCLNPTFSIVLDCTLLLPRELARGLININF